MENKEDITVFSKEQMLKDGFTEDDIKDILACNDDVRIV